MISFTTNEVLKTNHISFSNNLNFQYDISFYLFVYLELKRPLCSMQNVNHLIVITLKFFFLGFLYPFSNLQFSGNNNIQILYRHSFFNYVAVPLMFNHHFTSFNKRFNFFVCQVLEARDWLQEIDRLLEAAHLVLLNETFDVVFFYVKKICLLVDPRISSLSVVF